MSILNVTIDLISTSIIEIHGPVDFHLLKDFEQFHLNDEIDRFSSEFKPESEWCELMLTYIPDETLEGRVTAPRYYDYEILSEGVY
jgi:hypothetical protein